MSEEEEVQGSFSKSKGVRTLLHMSGTGPLFSSNVSTKAFLYHSFLNLTSTSGYDFQEEYVNGDDLGKLKCGHDFHTECIKQWLKQKNLCPICKATIGDTKEK